jgi:hypothetical protein
MLAATGALFLGLFAAGLLAADLVATTSFPEPSRPIAEVVAYFGDNAGSVRALSTFHAFAAVALLVFTAYAATMVRKADDVGLASIALAAGAVAAGFLLLDAALFWALASPAVAGDEQVVGGLHALSYLCGGVMFALPLGVFIACVARSALDRHFLPRWLGWAGVVAAVEAGVYGTTLLGAGGAWSPAGVLVLAALLPLLWIGAVSLVMVRSAPQGP